MAVSREQIVQQIVESGLLSAADLEAFVAALPEAKRPRDAEQLARELVRQKKLTAFQAQEIYARRGKKLVLGNYVILDKLGQGGMGMVLKAEHRRMARRVALKVLSPAAVGSPDAVRRFQREVQAAAKLIHPNIVTAFDADEAGSTHFLVMEYVEGSDLAQLVKKSGPLALDKALDCVLQAARGLEFAHKHGVVHRDIKPSNLLVAAEGTVKILDMGLARIESVGGDLAELTGTGQIMGTVDYMAPEQAMNTRTADHRADIYSLGITLWYLLAGKAAYEGETVMEKLMAHQRDPIPLLSSVNGNVTPELEAVFARMVAKTPDTRYSSMTEVIAALERCPSGGGVSPTVTLGPSKDNKLSDFLKGVGSPPRPGPSSSVSKSVAAAPSSAPAPLATAVASNLGDAFEQTIALNPGQSDTDPQTQTNLPGALGAAGAGPLTVTAPWWRNPTAQIVAGASGAALLLVLGLWFAFGGSAEEGSGGDVPTKAGWHGWPADAPPPAIAPFDAAQAKEHQRVWAEYLQLPVEYENSVGMKFVLIPPGEFLMGSTPAEIEAALKLSDQDAHRQASIRSEAPQHKVILTQPIYLAIHEVTQADFERVMGRNPSLFSPTGPKPEWAQKVAGLNTARHPVDNVSWNDAARFCIKLSEQEKLTPFYSPSEVKVTMTGASGYRLPTEAVWEFACRAGTTGRFWTGNHDSDLTQAAWFEANSDNRSHPVAELRANPFGLYDCHGNIWEWVNDCWEPTYYGQFQKKPALNPRGPTLEAAQRALGNAEQEDVLRVLRGGELMDIASECRASARLVEDPYMAFFLFGFRVSLPVESVKQATAAKAARNSNSTTGWPGWPADAPPPAIAPFNAMQAQQHQQAWAAYLGMPVEKEVTLPGGAKLTMVLIPPGEFLMGSTDDERAKLMAEAQGSSERWMMDWIPSEGPQHRVRITQPFYLGKHEVTQAQWTALMGRNPASFPGDASQPVEQVSWQDIQPFLAKLNADAAPAGMKFVLPTEAQWEYACRAGTTSTWHSGESAETVPQYAWINANAGGKPHPVGQLQANHFGLHDMYGNVWERCADWQAIDYYAKSPVDDPPGAATGTHHVERGGSCFDGARVCRSASHFHGAPETRGNNHGFRVAATIDGVKRGNPDGALPATNPVAQPSAPLPARFPFNAPAAPKHQQVWASYLGVRVEEANGVGMTMVLIPPGTFPMGRSASDATSLPRDKLPDDDLPAHAVTLTKPFAIAATEVTQKQWKEVMGTTPWAGKQQAVENPDCPATYVSWRDATQFCQRLSTREGVTYRLPTEAEWEWACRAGTETTFNFGNDVNKLREHAWGRSNSQDLPHPVAQLAPNHWGLFDMHGNAWEWADDRYGPYSAEAAVDPRGPSFGDKRTLRGGCFWSVPAGDYRSAARRSWPEGLGYSESGFRPVRTFDIPLDSRLGTP